MESLKTSAEHFLKAFRRLGGGVLLESTSGPEAFGARSHPLGKLA